MEHPKQETTVPPAAEIRRRLTELLRETSVLRRLLRVAEHAERISSPSVNRKAVRHAH